MCVAGCTHAHVHAIGRLLGRKTTGREVAPCTEDVVQRGVCIEEIGHGTVDRRELNSRIWNRPYYANHSY